MAKVHGRIDLDMMLHGTPNEAQVAEFFRNGDFPEESHLVEAIEKHLMTDGHRRWMYAEKITVADMLNGRVDPSYSHDVRTIFSDWNARLGFRGFE